MLAFTKGTKPTKRFLFIELVKIHKIEITKVKVLIAEVLLSAFFSSKYAK